MRFSLRWAASGAKPWSRIRSAGRFALAGCCFRPRGRRRVCEAIGLGVLAERDPLRASSRGLGAHSCGTGRWPAGLVVGLGGTATMDGGAGMREVLSSLPVGTVALCDVRTRLADAARLYAPQKGASPDDVRELERRIAAVEPDPVCRAPQLQAPQAGSGRRSRRSVPASFPEPAGSSSASTFARTCATPTWP